MGQSLNWEHFLTISSSLWQHHNTITWRNRQVTVATVVCAIRSGCLPLCSLNWQRWKVGARLCFDRRLPAEGVTGSRLLHQGEGPTRVQGSDWCWRLMKRTAVAMVTQPPCLQSLPQVYNTKASNFITWMKYDFFIALYYVLYVQFACNIWSNHGRWGHLT